MLEQKRQQRREEEESTEKTRETVGRVEVAATAEMMERRPEEARPVTRDGENGNRIIPNNTEVAEKQRIEASMNTSTGQESTTPLHL